MAPSAPLHAGHAAPPTLPVRLAIGIAAGLLAAAVAAVPATRQREGRTPAFLAAAALTGDALVDVSEPAATAVHYGTGALAGGLLAALATGFEAALEPGLVLAAARLYVVPHLLAGAVVLTVLYALFAYGLVPGYDLSAERTARVRRQWAVSAITYAVALLAVVPVLTMFLA